MNVDFPVWILADPARGGAVVGPGSLGVRGSNPLSSTERTRDHTASGFLLAQVGEGRSTTPSTSLLQFRAHADDE